MTIEGKNYKLDFDGKDTLTMSGKLSAMPEEYEKIEVFFEQVLDAATAKTSHFVLDLRDLVFLNSSGIKSICVCLVMEADEIPGLHLKILCKKALTWQVETIPTFKDLMENLEIVFE